MKLALLIFVCAIATLATIHCQEIGTKYSGRAEIPGLGVVEFPAGEWFLEFRRSPPVPNPAHRPDYFGFRKVAELPERLGFRRYSAETAAEQLAHYLDGIGEDLGEGAPSEVLGVSAVSSTSYPMRFEPPIGQIKPDTTDIVYSFINVKPTRPLHWLCHAHLYTKQGEVFVIFHASPMVTDPETVREINWIPQSRSDSSGGRGTR
jgi:hypothetical protein